MRSGLAAWSGLIPFFVFIGMFLVVPTIAVFRRAFEETGGGETQSAMTTVLSRPRMREFFLESFKLSFASAAIGGLLGVLLALAVVRIERPRWLRTAVLAFCGVAANMGGVILAFMFIASLATQGLLTKLLTTLGVSIGPSFITSFWGLVVVYMFFQIPLMFLVVLPAVDGLKPAWREAVSNLGGTTATYWRRVGIPVLTPAVLGGFLLLFANSFAAYATAQELTTRAVGLVSVQIRVFLQGEQSSTPNLGYALAAWMIVCMIVAIGVYLALRRRSERWQR